MPDDITRNRGADEHLIHASLAGNPSAFSTLVERHWNLVFALALSRISNATEAEDIAQESFLKAYTQLSTLRKPSCFAGWLTRITLRECTNTVRRSTRRKAVCGGPMEPQEVLNAVPACAANPGLTSGQADFVRQTVRRLPKNLRELVLLRFMGGFSAVKIAEQLGKRPGTVRVSLHRAYKLLRKDLNPLLEEIGS